eukprot:Skav229940  [mRNA]  locus=scaffold4282:66813:68629:+ [translate_table: standard]
MVLLLSIFLAPDPTVVLGSDLGRLVVIARSLLRIFTFMWGTLGLGMGGRSGISVTYVHPQFAALEHVMKNLREKPPADQDRLSRAIDLVDDYGWNHGFLINVGDVTLGLWQLEGESGGRCASDEIGKFTREAAWHKLQIDDSASFRACLQQ